MNTSTLLQTLEKLQTPRVMVIGDLILDEYIHGEIRRISREAPVPIVVEQGRDYKPGGAANTLANLAALGAKVSAVGVIGKDDSGQNLLKLLNSQSIDTEMVLSDPQVPTTTKTRISAQSRQSVMQQVLRLDKLPDQPLSPETLAHFFQILPAKIQEMDVVVISDYGNGVITPPLIAAVREAVLAQNKIWIVDSQEDLRLFKGATLLTPNKPEAESNLGYLIQTQAQLHQAGQTLLELTEAEAVLITRGDEGMSLFEQSGHYSEVPALNRSEVFDVTGAGDTVVATLALALGSGLDKVSAMHLANLAASIVVRRLGCSTTHPDEMKTTVLASIKENTHHD